MNGEYRLVSHLFRYEGMWRLIAKGVKEGDLDCIKMMAEWFAPAIPVGSVVIPMPGHRGYATYMNAVAYSLKNIKHVEVVNCLNCSPHEPLYDIKKSGKYAYPIDMYADIQYINNNIDERTFIIDNVVHTGNTASAALAALPYHRKLMVLGFCKGAIK